MKKYIYLFCLAILMLSCTSDNYFISEDPTPPETDELVALSFGCGGELVNVVSSPMTKAVIPNDLYLFVFWEHKGGDENWDTNWQEYGYIFTDDPAVCQMLFRKNKKYICDALCIPNGKKLIAEENGVYGYPFNMSLQEAPTLNKVFYGTHDFLAGFVGCTTPKGSSIDALSFNSEYSNQYNSIDKYFGFKKFEAKNESKIDINLYRMMYSITLKISNFKSGKIKIWNKIEINPDEVPFTHVTEMDYLPYSLGRDPNYADVKDYEDFIKSYCCKGSSPLIIKYVDKDGNETVLFNKDIERKRLTNYDISFDLEQVLASDNMGIETNLKNEDITNSGSISL